MRIKIKKISWGEYISTMKLNIHFYFIQEQNHKE